MFLASAVRASGFSPALRQRMSAELLVDQPFRQLARVAEQFREHAEAAGAAGEAALLQEAQYLRALLDTCRLCAGSVHDHLEAHGVSVDVVFEVDQLRERTRRIDALLNCVDQPRAGARDRPADRATWCAGGRAPQHPRADVAATTRCWRARSPSAAPRPASTTSPATAPSTGACCAPRPAAARCWRAPRLHQVRGAGALGLSRVLGRLRAGRELRGAASCWSSSLHFTVATKQPAMTAPAMAEKLADVSSDARCEGFVDEVAQLIRSQAAGIFGNSRW